MKNLTQNLNIVAVPVGMLLGVILLGGILTKILVDNVNGLNQDISQGSSAENVLQAKLNSLEGTDPNLSSQESILSLNALPTSSSVLVAFSQIKKLTLTNGLSINNLRSSGDTLNPAKTIGSTQIDFEVDGTYPSLASFITQLASSAPVLRFDTIKITSQNSGEAKVYRLAASLFSYWAPLPTKLPAIDEPITKLTDDEQKILNRISVLTQPIFSVGGTAVEATSSGRPDPFQ